jgi:hypothetical protein
VKDSTENITVKTKMVSIMEVLSFLLNPGLLIQKRMENVSLLVPICISSASFTLFFLQTGLDIAKKGTASGSYLLLMALRGLLAGSLGVLVLASFSWLLAKMLGSRWKYTQTVKAFGMAYTSTLLYCIFGILANLILGWNTAIVFGITGLLWALSPLLAIFREMLENRKLAGIVLTTLCGAVMLLAWWTVTR